MFLLIHKEFLFRSISLQNVVKHDHACVRIISLRTESSTRSEILITPRVATKHPTSGLHDAFSVHSDFVSCVTCLAGNTMHVRLIVSHSMEILVFEDFTQDIGLCCIVISLLFRHANLSLKRFCYRLGPFSDHWATLSVELTSHLKHKNQQLQLCCIKGLLCFFQQHFLVRWGIGLGDHFIVIL